MHPILALLDGLGGPEILFIGILALLLFGSKRLPELGRAFGRGMREFKRATSGVEESLRDVLREDPLAPTIRPASRQVTRGRDAAASSAAASTSTTSGTPASSAPPAENTTPRALPEEKAGAEDEIAS